MPTKYTKEVLSPIISRSKFWSEVLRELGLKQTGGNQRNIQKWVRFHGIDYSHFSKNSWAKGLTKESSTSIAASAEKLRIPDSEIFKENGHPITGTRVVKRLLDKGVSYECNICGISTWRGERLTLQLDHINGLHYDNRIDNLRLLCPNCHHQTETWGNRTKKRGRTRIGSRGRI